MALRKCKCGAQCRERMTRCDVCNRIAVAAWRERNKDRIRRQTLLRRYGLTDDDFERMRKAQDGKCLFCDRTELVVDHCHLTGVVRGLLCRTHNAALGMFGDDPEILAAAVDYLESFA